jgi:hypothetical protein
MDKFKRKIRVRIIWMSAVLICIAFVYIALALAKDNLPVIPDFIRGFHTGVFTGIEIMILLVIVKYIASVRKEESLKKLFIEENDERKMAIMQKSGAWGMTACILGLAGATVVSGFFDQTVFFSLLGALIYTAAVKGILKIYYYRKL